MAKGIQSMVASEGSKQMTRRAVAPQWTDNQFNQRGYDGLKTGYRHIRMLAILHK